MTYIEAFDKIKSSMKNAKATGVDGHLAIQVNLSDSDASGIFYIEVKDGQVFVEPYNYYDNDAVFTVSTKDMIRIMTGKVTYEKAVQSGILTVSGNLDKAAEIRYLVVKEDKKAPAKKAAPTECAAKTTKSKCVKKADNNTPANSESKKPVSKKTK